MGATGHVARNLIENLKGDELFLFSRTKFNSYDFFDSYDYDAIINCIGYGNPTDIERAGPDLFFVTEKYDNLALNYLKTHEETKYVFISSGVVHSTVDVNHITKQSFYLIPKINAEAKHRALPKFNIIDIRLFSFFTRYTKLDAGFFMSTLIKAVKENREFITDESIMIRDYINPKDLVSLIKICISQNPINDAFDIYSLKPAEKFDITSYFQEKYNLKIKIVRKMESFTSVNKHIYVSEDSIRNSKTAILGYVPKFTSMQTIKEESSYLL